MFDLFGGFNATKLKPQLKMAVHRFQMASNKKSAILKQNMREVAVLLAEDPPKEEKARIKAEALIRDDDMIEAYDILSLNCELLSERIKLISFSKDCPPDLVSCIATLMYAAPRVDIPELQEIRKQFRAKYGKQFEENAMNNVGGVLNERVVTKLSVQPPAAYLVQTYLEQICEKYEVDWSPTMKLRVDQMGEPMAPPVGFSVPIARATGLGPMLPSTTGMTVATASEMSYDNNNNGVVGNEKSPLNLPTAPGQYGKQQLDDFEEPDIFIPAAPGQSKTVSSQATTPAVPPSAPPAPDVMMPPSSAPKGDNTNTNDKDDDPPSSSNTGGGSSQPPAAGGAGPSSSSSSTTATASYQDLAARFENLKNL